MKNATLPEQPIEAAGMLRSLKDLEGYRITARDGNIGKIHDFLLDDEFWILRYVVVDTGHWLPGRKVLLSPSVLLNPDWYQRSFTVALTQEQVKNSPDIDTDKPVSRQREAELHSHYGWPFYWMPDGAWPGTIANQPPPPPSEPPGDPHLRSLRDLVGYKIEATDGNVGFVDDFVAETEDWTVRYLIVATHRWLPGRKVLIAPQWLVGPISWAARTVKIILTCEQIKSSPQYDPASPVNREYETRLYDYYGRPRYWA